MKFNGNAESIFPIDLDLNVQAGLGTELDQDEEIIALFGVNASRS